MLNNIKQWAIDVWEHPTKLDNGAAIILVAVVAAMMVVVAINVGMVGG